MSKSNKALLIIGFLLVLGSAGTFNAWSAAEGADTAAVIPQSINNNSSSASDVSGTSGAVHYCGKNSDCKQYAGKPHHTPCCIHGICKAGSCHYE